MAVRDNQLIGHANCRIWYSPANCISTGIYGSSLIESQAQNPMFSALRSPKPLTRPRILKPMASLNQLAANRANAQVSTGPTSSEGSQNLPQRSENRSHRPHRPAANRRLRGLPGARRTNLPTVHSRKRRRKAPRPVPRRYALAARSPSLARSRNLRDRPPRAGRSICG